jgi:hypothetical protein
VASIRLSRAAAAKARKLEGARKASIRKPPSLQSPKVRTLLRVLREGATLTAAARYARLGITTVCHDWRHPEMHPPEHRPQYVKLNAAIEKALSTPLVNAATNWKAAFGEDWQAARDFLVRREPEWRLPKENAASDAPTVQVAVVHLEAAKTDVERFLREQREKISALLAEQRISPADAEARLARAQTAGENLLRRALPPPPTSPAR